MFGSEAVKERFEDQARSDSMLNTSNSEGRTLGAVPCGHYASGTLLSYPMGKVMVGAQMILCRQENFLEGFKSDDVHLQFPFQISLQEGTRVLKTGTIHSGAACFQSSNHVRLVQVASIGALHHLAIAAVHQAWAVETGGASGYGGAVAVMVAVVADQITNQ